MDNKEYSRRVSCRGITIGGKTYWDSELIKYVGEKVTLQYIDEDTIIVFHKSNCICQAKNKEMIYNESLVMKPWCKINSQEANTEITSSILEKLLETNKELVDFCFNNGLIDFEKFRTVTQLKISWLLISKSIIIKSQLDAIKQIVDLNSELTKLCYENTDEKQVRQVSKRTLDKIK
ncbi:Mu transposase C-terminal domain-containing protein [Clostridium lundense]|uniref:Mu transposase C-terminal domain-containing protein n=1 Tax=Clostridium lundense TaxID=319475 RepID=UPI00048995FF|nr:Mu transposase C-terminal domain-containing protein [Clostridium lundense]